MNCNRCQQIICISTVTYAAPAIAAAPIATATYAAPIAHSYAAPALTHSYAAPIAHSYAIPALTHSSAHVLWMKNFSHSDLLVSPMQSVELEIEHNKIRIDAEIVYL